VGWCYSLLVSRVWFWGRCYAAAAAGRHTHSQSNNKNNSQRAPPPPPSPSVYTCSVYSLSFSPHSLLACTCRNVASTTRTCPPPWLRTRIPETTSSESNFSARRCAEATLLLLLLLISIKKWLFKGLKLYAHPLGRQGNYPRSREVRCIFTSFDFFICAAAPCACLIGSARPPGRGDK